MLIDQQLVVGAVDRVVQHDPMKPDLDVPDYTEGPVQRKRVTDLRGHRVPDTFFLTVFCNVRPVGISQRDTN